MNVLQAILIAILQGATELFPVSSLGHAVIVPALMQSGINQLSPEFLPFLVFLHLGTAVALLSYFWRDWWMLFLGVARIGRPDHGPGKPPGFPEDRHRHHPGRHRRLRAGEIRPRPVRHARSIAAIFLVVNGLLLLFGERLRNRGHRELSTLTTMDALLHRAVAMHRADPRDLPLRRHHRRRRAARHHA